MKFSPRVSVAILLACLSIALIALKLEGAQFFRGYDSGDSYGSSNEKAEFYWSRLRYTPRASPTGSLGYSYGYGFGGGSWQRDYPKADRQFLMALRRLTRIQARSTEQVVDLDSDEIFNYPWVYAVQV